MKIIKGTTTAAVNNNTAYSANLAVGERLSYFEPLVQRIAGAGTCDVIVQGTLNFIVSNDDNNWADLIDVTGVNSNKLFTAGARLASYDFVRIKVTSAGAATIKLILIGIHI